MRGVLATTYSKAGVTVIQLATVPALANSWGLPLYGQWLMLITVPGFLTASDLGFGAAAGNRFIGEVARGDSDSARITFQSAWLMVLCSSGVIVAAALAASELMPDKLLSVAGGMNAGETRTVLVILSIYGVVAMQSILFLAAQRAHGGFATSVAFDSTVLFAEGIAVIAIAMSGGGPLQAAIALLIIRVVGVTGHVVLARRLAGWLSLGFGQVRRARVGELLRPAFAAMMMPLSQAVYLQGMALAVGSAAGAASVPIFTTLRTLSRSALQFLYAFNQPFLPEVTAEFARGNTKWLARVAGVMITFNACVGASAAVLLLFFGDSLLAWWTKGAVTAPSGMIALTAAAMVGGAIWNTMSYYLLAVNRHEAFTYVFALCAALTVVVCYISVMRWGVTGAAGANLVLELCMMVWVLAQIRMLIGPYPFGPSAIRLLVSELKRLRRVFSRG